MKSFTLTVLVCVAAVHAYPVPEPKSEPRSLLSHHSIVTKVVDDIIDTPENTEDTEENHAVPVGTHKKRSHNNNKPQDNEYNADKDVENNAFKYNAVPKKHEKAESENDGNAERDAISKYDGKVQSINFKNDDRTDAHSDDKPKNDDKNERGHKVNNDDKDVSDNISKNDEKIESEDTSKDDYKTNRGKKFKDDDKTDREDISDNDYEADSDDISKDSDKIESENKPHKVDGNKVSKDDDKADSDVWKDDDKADSNVQGDDDKNDDNENDDILKDDDKTKDDDRKIIKIYLMYLKNSLLLQS